MLAAAGRYRLFTDADGSTPIASSSGSRKPSRPGRNVAIGSRALADPACRWWRARIACSPEKLFAWMVRRLGLPASPIPVRLQSLLRRRREDLFGRLRTRGFGVDVELLLMAQRAGYRVARSP